MNNIVCKKFKNIDLDDEFFDSLKKDYKGFKEWFLSKENDIAYVNYDDCGNIQGFLYLKIEKKCVGDVSPEIEGNKILKIGTFKINAHGSKLGEQFIKVIMDYAIDKKVDLCYLTIFEKHKKLIKLVEKFGFYEYGIKIKDGGEELVYVKDMNKIYDDINKNYPLININGCKKYLLSVYPEYHSIMFPDSILKTEDKNIIKDISYTNSIHKIYICRMDVDILEYGDLIVIYRTSDKGKNAEYSSVATSICVVEEVKNQNDFNSFNDFFEYATQYSVFDKDDLYKWYKKGNCRTIKMTYNLALNKRIVRHDLIEEIGLERETYWGFFPLSNRQFKDILDYGYVDNSNYIIID